MAMIDLLTNRINTDGWLSIATLCFDNSYVINVFNSRGYIGYSPSAECFFSFNCLDSTDTEVIEHKVVTLDPGHIEQQQVLTVVGAEHLQHFSLAMYAQYRFFWDEQDTVPYPTIPKEAEIMAMIPDADTGLYPDTDTITHYGGVEHSTIDLYKDFFDYGKGDPYSGAVIDFWKMFYTNHTKFKTFMANAYSVSDII